MSIKTFRTTTILLLVFLFGDLLATVLAESRRGQYFTVVIAYVVQFLLLAANLLLLFIGFSGSYPFRAGLMSIMMREFAAALWGSGAYFVVMLVCRIMAAKALRGCDDHFCELWTAEYTTVYSIYRIVQLGYYYCYTRTAIQLCDPKYYKDSKWLRDQLRLQTP
ncbi:transmembrane protein 138-domain-containing protein [Phlyctochytrium arcticum]|nr:transmembrane protein 138-domain-containing protein [Phlyctochytrium arcticum]